MGLCDLFTWLAKVTGELGLTDLSEYLTAIAGIECEIG